MIDFIGAAGALPAKVAPAQPASTSPGIVDLELNLLLEGIYRVSGFDFRDYAPATLKRRIAERVRAEGLRTTTGLLERVLHDPAALNRLIDALTHNVSSPFRDPAFFIAFRERRPQ
ncbi:MAG: hypothetical protein ABR975_08115 [Vulcanimicrobiaceae bacterium]